SRSGSVREPGPEELDLLVRPGTIARHAPRGELAKDGVRVRLHVTVRPEIEVGQHRAPVALPEQRPDVGVIARHDETILGAPRPTASPATAIDEAALLGSVHAACGHESAMGSAVRGCKVRGKNGKEFRSFGFAQPFGRLARLA